MRNWLRRSRTAPVESFLVQAHNRVQQKQATRAQTLVRHLLSRFQADDTGEDEQTVRRTLFLCAAAAIPPVFIAVMLYPAYHPIAMPPAYRPYWSQVGDEYLYVLYSFAVMGVTSILQWESIFPDLLDVFVLAVLPLPPGLLLRSRGLALAILFGVALLCVAAPGTLLLPFVVEGPQVVRHLAAHALSAGAAGACSCTSLIALQSVLEIGFGVRLAKRFTPFLQAGALLALFVTLGYTPTLLNDLQQGSIFSSAAAGWLPPVWFLGMYEQIRGGAPDGQAWQALAKHAWLATAASLLAAAISYPIAYQRRTLFLIESGNAAVGGLRSPAWFTRLLHRTLVRTPQARATFHLIAQSVFRVSKLRTILTIYAGIGFALVLGTSIHQPTRAVAILACAVVVGGSAVIRRSFMPRSAWLFRIMPASESDPHVRGSTRVLALWATLAACGVLVVLLTGHGHGTTLPGVITAVTVALMLPAILAPTLLLGFRDFPFTEERETTPEHFVLSLLRHLIVFPAGVIALGWIAGKAERSTAGLLLWLAGAFLIAAAFHQMNRPGGVFGPSSSASDV
ncbi:hypothetical protein [Terriglobus sp.]|uniref:hypothetical protein n=1 Tax=Terriglobus sp. TaxID=1889013 RepID=UPI003AFFBB1E